MAMKNENSKERGAAYEAVRIVYTSSPGRSWRRLNSALQDVLTASITAHLSFKSDDFAAIMRDFNGGYWMGNSEGSRCGERYYSLAVKCGHTSACVSFERYANRPALLWSEDVKTPERLSIGSEFTWNGVKLTVTNIMSDYLVACSYKRWGYRDGPLAVGSYDHFDGGYRQIEFIERSETGISVRLGPQVDDPGYKPERIVKVKFEELAAVRKQFELARRNALKAIAEAMDVDALDKVAAELAGKPPSTFRHFDIEDICTAIRDRKKAIVEAEERSLSEARQKELRKAREASYVTDLEDWVNGAPARQWFHDVRLRVNPHNQRVETSTGQSASVASVRRVLPVVLRRRNSFGPVSNLSVDTYPVVEQSEVGVKVGCTLVPWEEVEQLPRMLEQVS